MKSSEARFQTRHPEKGKSGPRISKAKYDAVRKAILKGVPLSGEGILFRDLPGKVKRSLPPSVAKNFGSINWYTVVVKLDLEARGEIRRAPGAGPQRLLRSR